MAKDNKSSKGNTSETEVKKTRTSRKPAAIVYSEGDNVTIALAHPDRKDVKAETGNGMHEVLGRFMDKGYTFCALKENECPPWATKHLPKGASLLGCVVIRSFPWV
jgi:hypothetical protein